MPPAKAPRPKPSAKTASAKTPMTKAAPKRAGRPTAPSTRAAKKTAAPKKQPAAPGKSAPRKTATPSRSTPAKADGDAAVDAWIAGIKPEHQATAKRFDALVRKTVPGIQRAIKWKTPFYGLQGKGWIATMASFNDYMSLGFFAGVHLTPAPPLGDSGNMRRVNLHAPTDYHEAQVQAWLKQASRLQGWGTL